MFAWLLRSKVVFKTFNPIEVRDLLRDEDTTFVLADVREDNEWASGHIEGAIHVPLSRFDQAMKTVPLDKTPIFYCHNGWRSKSALRRAKRFQMTAGGHLGGGILKWRNFNLPITR